MLEFLPTYAVIYLFAVVGILGLVMGSALNCLSWRIANGKKWSGKSRSVCAHCGHELAAKDLIPLVSWLALKGKCRYCGKKISPRYILAEILLAVIYISLLWRFDLSLHTLSAAVLCSCLFCLSLVDLDTQIIPDRFLVIPAVVRVAELLFTGGFSALLGGIWPGLVIAGAVLVLSLVMDKVLKKDTMGGGDIKLLAVLGMFLTFPQCLLMVMFACVIGIVMASVLMKVDSETAFPFGPALSLAAWLVMLFGDGLIGWYLGLFL